MSVTGDKDLILCLMSNSIDKPIHGRIADGFKKVFEGTHYEVKFGVISINPRKEVLSLVEYYQARLAGIALEPWRPNLDVISLILSDEMAKMPYVMIGHYFADIQVPSCVVDNYGGMYAATEILIRAGRKRLAFVGEISMSSTENERYQGFLMACIHGGIGVPPNWFIKQSFSYELKKNLTNIFAEADVPDALVCEHDILAYNSIKILRELGLRVPQDVAVICMGDDMDVADKSDPTISTAHHPAFELGAVSAVRLLDMIHEGKPSGNHVLVWPVSLRLRQSCGTPKHLRPADGQSIHVPFSNFIGVCADVGEVSKRLKCKV